MLFRSRRLVQQGVKLMMVMDIVADRDAALPPTTQANIPFSRANDLLDELGEDPVDWSLAS